MPVKKKIVIYITREIKPSFYYPCVAVKTNWQSRGFSKSRLLFYRRDSERKRKLPFLSRVL